MFTGIVEELGEVVRLVDAGGDSAVIAVRGPVVTTDARHGDSISVNGVCLTATHVGDGGFRADVMNETLRRSSLGEVRAGSRVNLELPLTPDARLGGHFVQGHVDGVGAIAAVREDGFARILTIDADPDLLRYVVEKGSITVDGVSLTVAAVDDTSFAVSLIPETLERTNLGAARKDTIVNLEVDILARYVARLLEAGRVSPSESANAENDARLMERLRAAGYA